MKLEWMGEYRDLVEKLIRYCNQYAQCYTIEQSFNTDVKFSFSQLQVMEYILENEERRENMAAIAARIGISPSAFSKNVKKMMEKGLLEKYHSGSNRKDIIICVSNLGRQTYEQYSKFVYDNGFKRAFSILDAVPKEYIALFAKSLDTSGNTDSGSNNKQDDPLVKIE